MKNQEKSDHSPRMFERPPKPASSKQAACESSSTDVKLMLVPFRNGEAVDQHPVLQPWLEKSWRIRSAVPRIVERGDTKLLVILERPIFGVESSRSPASQRIRPLHK